MIFTAENETADNGMRVNSTIELIGEADEHNSWRAQVSVGGATMYTSHHDTRAKAERARSSMHKTYLEVHSRS